MFFMEGKPKPAEPQPAHQQVPPSNEVRVGIDNRSYIPDNITMQQLSGRTSDKNYY